MDLDSFMFWAVPVFVVTVWLLMLHQWGHVENVTDSGFVFKPFIGKRIALDWKELRAPFRIERNFMPRVTVGLVAARFRSIRPSLVVLLRFTPSDEAFVAQMQSRFGLREIKTLRDFF